MTSGLPGRNLMVQHPNLQKVKHLAKKFRPVASQHLQPTCQGCICQLFRFWKVQNIAPAGFCGNAGSGGNHSGRPDMASQDHTIPASQTGKS